jgi:hypothetical protein
MKKAVALIVISFFVMIGSQSNKANAQANLGALKERFGKARQMKTYTNLMKVSLLQKG